MSNRWKWISLVACGTIALVLVWALFAKRDREPSYQGRTLSAWLEQINQHGWDASDEAQAAIRAIGTNAFPTCLKWLSYERSPSRNDLAKEHRAILCPWVFYILRSEAHATLPEVVRLAQTSSDPLRASRCIDVLANIGPDALPSVLTLVSNSPTDTRLFAILMLEVFETNAAVAIPVLLPMLTDPEYKVRRATTNVLLQIAPAIFTNPPAN